MRKRNTLYILSNARVAAIDKKTGAIVWEVKLKEYVGGSLAHAIGQIMYEDEKLYVGCNGILLCLSAKDGAFIWKNELKGWGYNFISMANTGIDAAGAATAATASSAAIISATTTATT